VTIAPELLEARVLDWLDRGPASVNKLSRACGASLQETAQVVNALADEGLLRPDRSAGGVTQWELA